MTKLDRAAVITRAIMQITSTSSVPEPERRLHIEALIRDELDDLRREVAADRRDDNA
jgi:hypothetical protein